MEGLSKSNMSPFQCAKQCGGLKKILNALELSKVIVFSSIFSFPLFSGFNDSEHSHSDENPFFLKTSGDNY